MKYYTSFSRLRLTVLAFCGGLLTLMWIGLGYQLSYERNFAIERREAENDNLARLFEEHVRRTLAAAGVTLKQLETEYGQHGERLDLAKYFHDRRDELAPYSVLSVLDEHGNLKLSSVSFTKPQNYRNLENIQFHMRDASPGVFISTPRLGTVTGRLTIYLTRRMNKADGTFGGYTLVGMDPQYFSRFYDQIDLGADSVVTLVGRDGVIRARRSDAISSEKGIGRDMHSNVLLSVHLKQAENGKFRATSPIDGVQRLYSYRAIKGYSLVTLVGTSEADTLAQFEKRKKMYLWTAGVASVVIFAFAALALFQMSREARVTEKLRMSEERYALVERATNHGIWDRNLQSGEAYLSPRGKGLLGYRDDEPRAEEASFFERVHPGDDAKVREALAQSVRDGTPYQSEYRLRHKDGSYRWVLSRGDVIRNEDGEAARMVGSISDITDRVRAEEQIRDYVTRMRALSGRIVTLQEEERRALARELHDEIGQELTAVKIHLQAAELTCEGGERTFPTENLHEALLAVAKILEQVRGLCLNLRPMQLDDLGLTVALSGLVARTADTAGWIAHFDEDLSAERLESNLELACYRVTQEALTNVMRHAGAGEVWITLRRSDEALLLTVRDNGCGFDLASARSATGTPHLGLLGMEERVKNMGGQFEIRSTRGEGTEVRASFPIATAVATSAGLAYA